MHFMASQMPTLKNIFLSVLVLTVASGVKGSTTTVTFFDVVEGPVDTAVASLKVVDVSAIGVESNGGTAYVEKAQITVTPVGESPVTTTQALTLVEAASWLYLSVQNPSAGVGLVENCTVGRDGSTAECIEIARIAEAGVGTLTTTMTVPGQVVPIFTLTVTGPLPTSSIAATISSSSSVATILTSSSVVTIPSSTSVVIVPSSSAVTSPTSTSAAANPTSSSAATILYNPIFNWLPNFFGGILFIVMFF